jgi:hypothetical protein
MTTLKPGDKILFDHFGATDRPGTVVRVTGTAVLVAWTAPSSGITRTVRLRHVAWPGREDRPTQLEERRLRLAKVK